MVASLPPNIQLKLEQTLQQWRQWRCDTPLTRRPKPVFRFKSGISNYSVLVEAQQHFVIRIDGVHAAANSLSRTSEWRALRNAYQADLAPCPRYYNPELGTLVCDFLPEDKSSTPNLSQTATLLHCIHQLPALHHRLDLRERILSYERQLAQQNQELPAVMANSRDFILTLVESLSGRGDPLVLCHNDLLAANRLYSSGMLRAIDWEYCAMGSAWFDLAVVIIGDKLSKVQQQELLNKYLKRAMSCEEELCLAQYCLVYQYLDILWYMAFMPDDKDLSPLVAMLQARYQQLKQH